MKSVKSSSNEVQTDSMQKMVQNVAFILLIVFVSALFMKRPEASTTAAPDAARPTSAAHDTMSREMWAALEYAQTCMESIKDPEHCAEYIAEFTPEQLAMDLTKIEIR